MADDLSNYKLQLQQVEVALLTDADNSELLKLKDDIGKTIFLLEVNKRKLFSFSGFRTINHAPKGTDQDHRSRTKEIR
jgi:hypothetical protein